MIASLMVALSLLSILVFFQILPVPFLNDFSRPEDVVEADGVPCFPEGSTPSDPSTIHATVLNATGRPGLAGSIASALEAQGVVIDSTGNYQGQYYGSVKLTAGRSQVVNAYTLARVFQDSTVRYALSDANSVTIIIGERFSDLPSNEDVAHLLSSETPLKQAENCKVLPPIDEEEAPAEDTEGGTEEGAEDGTSEEGTGEGAEEGAPEETEAQ
ncbi:MAG: LytR C-terminal domain-containing protein [Actinomycetaceae bacterium]|nr:LytR C-terminal domain-containing protein [Actinomycetaceae bacterium]